MPSSARKKKAPDIKRCSSTPDTITFCSTPTTAERASLNSRFPRWFGRMAGRAWPLCPNSSLRIKNAQVALRVPGEFLRTGYLRRRKSRTVAARLPSARVEGSGTTETTPGEPISEGFGLKVAKAPFTPTTLSCEIAPLKPAVLSKVAGDTLAPKLTPATRLLLASKMLQPSPEVLRPTPEPP